MYVCVFVDVNAGVRRPTSIYELNNGLETDFG